MNVREWMNNNSALVTIIAVVVLVICLGLIFLQMGGPGRARITEQYYYDLNTGKLFAAEATATPPIDAPSGPFNDAPGGVKAYVYACESCPGGLTGMTAEQVRQEGATIAYLEVYPLEAKQAMEAAANATEAPPPGVYEAQQANLVKAPQGQEWAKMYSRQGMQLMDTVSNLCPDGTPVFCTP